MKERKPSTTARNKVMDYLARRDHSEKELRQKLKRQYSSEEIEIAINYGKDRGWIPNDAASRKALAVKAAESLHRKKKGIIYINSFLKKKGLPEVESNDEQELEKAQELVKNKYSLSEVTDSEEKRRLVTKLSRFLLSRGFRRNTIQQVISRGRK